MRSKFPSVQADDSYQLSGLSDSTFLSADANNATNQYPLGAIYYGGSAAANIAVKMAQGTNVVFKNVQPGTILPIAVTQVRSTSSTALAADILILVGRAGI